MVTKTPMRQLAIALPSGTINVNLLIIRVQGSLYKYQEIEPPCMNYTEQTSLRHRAYMATSGMVCMCVPWRVDGTVPLH